MKILVTGGCGFIGSYLAEHCYDAGYSVAILDDLSTGRISNIAGLVSKPEFSFIHGSILDPDVLHDAVQDADIVFHLAAAVGVELIIKDVLSSIHANVRGTLNVLEACAVKDVRVVLASTSEVYGKSREMPLREDRGLTFGSPSVRRWSYGIAKALDEVTALAYWREKNIRVTVLRFFNMVGPRQSPANGMVLPRFVGHAVAGEALRVLGSGQQRRCFTDVRDIIPAVLTLACSAESVGEIVNVGNDVETTIDDLAKLVIARTGSESIIQHVSYEQAYGSEFEDVERRVPDLEKLHRLVGPIRHRPLEETVRAIADSLKEMN